MGREGSEIKCFLIAIITLKLAFATGRQAQCDAYKVFQTLSSGL